jgi:lipopolysaccharide transport system permease protein
MTTLAVPHAAEPAAPPTEEVREVVIEPRRGWIGVDWKELWRYRELLYFLVWREVKVEYKMAILGLAWAVLVPLVSMLVYGGMGAVFGLNDGAYNPSNPDVPGLPLATYLVSVFVALVPWQFIQKSISGGGLTLVAQQPLLTKIYLPRLFLPVSAVASQLVAMAISMTLLLVLLVVAFAVDGYTPDPVRLLAVIPLVGLVFLLAAGSAILLSALTLLYRDLRFLIPFLTQFGLWLSAVFYPIGQLGDKYWILAFNPYAGVISGFKSAIMGEPWQPLLLASSTIGGVVLLLIGLAYFRRVERRFADIA